MLRQAAFVRALGIQTAFFLLLLLMIVPCLRPPNSLVDVPIAKPIPRFIRTQVQDMSPAMSPAVMCAKAWRSQTAVFLMRLLLGVLPSPRLNVNVLIQLTSDRPQARAVLCPKFKGAQRVQIASYMLLTAPSQTLLWPGTSIKTIMGNLIKLEGRDMESQLSRPKSATQD